MNRNNILYLHSHDTGTYVQPYGHAVATPHIQDFAQQGVLFRKAFCEAPTCSPSRAALLTGQAAHSCGMFGLVNRGFSLRDETKVLPKALLAAGYETLLAGVTHIVRDPTTLGYGSILATSDSGLSVAAAAVDYLTSSPRQPFFLDVGFYPTHRPFPEPVTGDDPRYTRPPAPLPDTPETRRDMASFNTSARLLDNCVGAVLHALDKSGLADNTLVILTTDHGIAFPGMKCTLTDHGMGVMLILRGPASCDGTLRFSGGSVVDALVSHIDLFPTLCEVAGLPPPSWLQGVSLVPLVNAQCPSVRDEVFAEVNFHCGYEPMRAVRTPRWKYIRRFHDYPVTFAANCDPSPSKDTFLQYGWEHRPVSPEELYDLVFDPSEACNLADNPGHATVLNELRGRLDRWMRETEDPLLSGSIRPPAGAQVNAPTDLHPRDIDKRA